MEITPIVAEEYRLKTWKVVLNVIASLALAIIISIVAAIILYFLRELPVIGPIFRLILRDDWIITGPVVIITAISVPPVMDVLNRKTPLERSLSLNITGWILIVMGTIGLVVGLIRYGNLNPGDGTHVMIGIALKGVEKIGVHFKK